MACCFTAESGEFVEVFTQEESEIVAPGKGKATELLLSVPGSDPLRVRVSEAGGGIYEAGDWYLAFLSRLDLLNGADCVRLSHAIGFASRDQVPPGVIAAKAGFQISVRTYAARGAAHGDMRRRTFALRGPAVRLVDLDEDRVLGAVYPRSITGAGRRVLVAVFASE